MPALAKLHDPVTNHMRADFASIGVEQTVGEALAAIRAKPPEGRVIYFYVTDRDNKLCGVVPTRRLLLSPLERSVSEIMVRDVVTLPSSATVLDSCEVFTLHRLLALPIVDGARRLLGIVDVELYTSEVSDLERSQHSNDLFQLIGVYVRSSKQASAWQSFRGRFPWLLCNVAGGLVAAVIAGIFEPELQKAVALALFIPVVLALAESVSIQSVSIALQVLHGRPPNLRSLLQKTSSESAIGLMLGLGSALLVGSFAMLWLGQKKLAFCLLGGIVGGVSCAAVIGMAMPNLLRIMQREPQVAAGPIALAATDLLTLLFYFGLARAVYS